VANLTTYNALPQEDKDAFQAYLSILRPACSALAIVSNHIDVADVAFDARISTLLNGFSSDDQLPNTTGLDGALPLSIAQINAFNTLFRAVLALTNTAAQRQAFSAACGPRNIIG